MTSAGCLLEGGARGAAGARRRRLEESWQWGLFLGGIDATASFGFLTISRSWGMFVVNREDFIKKF